LIDEDPDDIDVVSLTSSEGTIDMDISLDTTDVELDEEDEEAIVGTRAHSTTSHHVHTDATAQNLAAPTPPITVAVIESTIDTTDYSDLLARTDVNVASTSRADRVQHIVRVCVGDRHAMIHTMSKQILEHYVVNKQVCLCSAHMCVSVHFRTPTRFRARWPCVRVCWRRRVVQLPVVSACTPLALQ
jgi:hypothetical protein